MKEAAVLVLVIVALAEVTEALDAGLKVKFGVGQNPEAGTQYYMPMPKTVAEATAMAWRQTARPPGPLPKLKMYCPPNHDVCCHFDDNGFVAGMQIGLSKDNFTQNVFDWKKRGFKLWKTTVNGRITEIWTLQLYLASAESLQRSKKERLAARDPSRMLQENAIWVTGTNGELRKIPTNESDILNQGIFTYQACFPGMGQHYFYNFSSTTPLNAENAYPWFPLYTNGELIGVGFATFGIFAPANPNVFEKPTESIIKLIAPRAPQWTYDLTSKPGAVTLHVYFTSTPWLIKC